MQFTKSLGFNKLYTKFGSQCKVKLISDPSIKPGLPTKATFSVDKKNSFPETVGILACLALDSG